MKFKDILDGLQNGKHYTCDRWGTDNVYIKELNYIEEVNGRLRELRFLVLYDINRGVIVPFTPSYENMTDDNWYEVIL